MICAGSDSSPTSDVIKPLSFRLHLVSFALCGEFQSRNDVSVFSTLYRVRPSLLVSSARGKRSIDASHEQLARTARLMSSRICLNTAPAPPHHSAAKRCKTYGGNQRRETLIQDTCNYTWKLKWISSFSFMEQFAFDDTCTMTLGYISYTKSDKKCIISAIFISFFWILITAGK